MAVDHAIPRAPAGLKAAGRGVWRRIHEDLGAGWVLTNRELVVLEAAARQADTNAALEAAIKEAGVVVIGSRGQPRMSQAVTELRQGRLALERLLGSLALPDEDGDTMTSAQRRAQAAASSRWIREQRGARPHG